MKLAQQLSLRQDNIKLEFIAFQQQDKIEISETKEIIKIGKPMTITNTEDIQSKISSMIEKTPDGKYKCRH